MLVINLLIQMKPSPKYEENEKPKLHLHIVYNPPIEMKKKKPSKALFFSCSKNGIV